MFITHCSVESWVLGQEFSAGEDGGTVSGIPVGRNPDPRRERSARGCGQCSASEKLHRILIQAASVRGRSYACGAPSAPLRSRR